MRTFSSKYILDRCIICNLIQNSSKLPSHNLKQTFPANDRAKQPDKSFLVVRAGQAGAELQSIGLAGEGNPSYPQIGGGAYQAKFNITVPLPQESNRDRALLSSSSASLHDHSMSEYSSNTHSGDSSVNDSGVVGDHDQDSLYDLAVNNMEGNIINCKEKAERKPSKIDIPFVVSIGNSGLLNTIGFSVQN